MNSAEEPKPPLEKMTLMSFLRETFRKIRRTNRWYLLPVWILLVLLAIVIAISGHGSILPAIYMAF